MFSRDISLFYSILQEQHQHHAVQLLQLSHHSAGLENKTPENAQICHQRPQNKAKVLFWEAGRPKDNTCIADDNGNCEGCCKSHS